jgi:hypothetical protein
MIKYSCPFLSVESGVFPVIEHMWLSASVPWVTAEYTEFPVFKPNEFFWKKHQRKEEEQWQTYARVVREIMSRHSGVSTQDINIETKYEYKKMIFQDHSKDYSQ